MVHIGQKIKRIIEKKGITISSFGKRINKSRENVYDIFKRRTIDTGLLTDISKVLEHDFFQYYSDFHEEEIDRLKEENTMLRDMNKLLKEKIKTQKK
jgi:transcriptional regulator with XRE-family HTH domain